MKHENIENLIQKYLDREISTEEHRALRGHLSKCGECRKFYEEMVQTGQELSQLTEFFPGYDFNARVLTKLGLKKSRVWAAAATVFAGAWIASLLLVVFSPWTGQVINRILTSLPVLARFVDNIGFAVSLLSRFIQPLTKNPYSIVHPVLGLIISILIFYVLHKSLQKEAKCKA